MATEVAIDYLACVRKSLNAMPSDQLQALAVNVGLTLPTLYNIRKSAGDVKYGNVMKLYKAIKKAEGAAVKKAARKAQVS